MPTLNTREDLLDLIKQSSFTQLLALTSEEDFDLKVDDSESTVHLCYSLDDDEPATGIQLFDLPIDHQGMGDPWGTWLRVEKLFGKTKYPFRVSQMDYRPAGHDVDVSDVGDFQTLGLALDAAFVEHEGVLGTLDRAALFDQQREHVRGDRIGHAMSVTAYAVDQALGMAIEAFKPRESADPGEVEIQSQVLEKAWLSQIPLPDALEALKALPALIEPIERDYPYDAMHAAASEINQLYFGGQGKLISYTHPSLQEMGEECGVDTYGTVFVAIEGAGSQWTFISADCGVHNSLDSARDAVAEKLRDRWAPALQNSGSYWLEPQQLTFDIHADKLHVSEAPAFKVDSEYKDNPEWLISRAVVEASRPYRNALQEKVENSLRAELDSRLSEESSFSR